MSYTHNHNFSIYFTLPALKKRVLIIFIICRKLGVSFWKYLNDRVANANLIPKLSDLIRQQALNPG